MQKPSPESAPPRIALIVAMTKDRVIGDRGKLPWELAEDLQLFKSLTLGNTVIMGRKTFASIGSPLPGRNNIVLSRSPDRIDGATVCPSFIRALAAASEHHRPVFVIGGAELYAKALPLAAELHISWVDQDVPGDVFFPELDLEEWSACDEKRYPGFTYVHYRRNPE